MFMSFSINWDDFEGNENEISETFSPGKLCCMFFSFQIKRKIVSLKNFFQFSFSVFLLETIHIHNRTLGNNCKMNISIAEPVEIVNIRFVSGHRSKENVKLIGKWKIFCEEVENGKVKNFTLKKAHWSSSSSEYWLKRQNGASVTSKGLRSIEIWLFFS